MRAAALALLVALAVSRPVARGSPSREVRAIDAAIARLLSHGIPEFKIKPCPRCKVAKDVEARRELAAAIDRAAGKHGISAALLIAVAFREGGFRRDAVGALGELSTFQLAPTWLSRCGCTDLTMHGCATDCAAQLFQSATRRCGSLEGGFAWYATGKTCQTDAYYMRKLVEDRFGIARVLDGWMMRAQMDARNGG